MPNGNTLINEGADGRVFEVTSDHQIVWEYVYPFIGSDPDTRRIYRAYRVPYEWGPQLEGPKERSVTPPVLSQFRIAPQ